MGTTNHLPHIFQVYIIRVFDQLQTAFGWFIFVRRYELGAMVSGGK